jgi:hypothetical protein
MIVLREASANGTEQFSKEIALTNDWKFVSIELSSFRRTWGTEGTNSRLEVDHVTGFGIEPLDRTRRLEIVIDAIRIVAPK